MAGKLMTKSQFVSLIAEKNGLTKAAAGQILESISSTAIAETKKNGQFVVPGLGKLVKSHRKARMGRNPQTGASIKIPAKTVVKFRVAKAAKDAIVPPKK
jgi:DNA-binding protein HU-beta